MIERLILQPTEHFFNSVNKGWAQVSMKQMWVSLESKYS